MNDQEKAVLASLSVEAKAAFKVLAKSVLEKDVPALMAAENQRLPLAFQGFGAAAEAAIYPMVLKGLEDAIDKL